MKVFNLQVEAWVGEDGVFKRAENPALQLKEDEPELLGGSMAGLGWKHILHLIGGEVQINQKAAPDDKGEKGAQAWCEGLLLGGRKVGDLGPG